MPSATNNISRRELLAGAGAGAAALLLDQTGLPAQTPPGTTVVFTHTTVANADAPPQVPHRPDACNVGGSIRSTFDDPRDRRHQTKTCRRKPWEQWGGFLRKRLSADEIIAERTQ